MGTEGEDTSWNPTNADPTAPGGIYKVDSRDQVQLRIAQPPPFVARMRAERAELSLKLSKLLYFRSGPAIEELSLEDQGLLRIQCDAMSTYLATLDLRLARAEAAA